PTTMPEAPDPCACVPRMYPLQAIMSDLLPTYAFSMRHGGELFLPAKHDYGTPQAHLTPPSPTPTTAPAPTANGPCPDPCMAIFPRSISDMHLPLLTYFPSWPS